MAREGSAITPPPRIASSRVDDSVRDRRLVHRLLRRPNARRASTGRASSACSAARRTSCRSWGLARTCRGAASRKARGCARTIPSSPSRSTSRACEGSAAAGCGDGAGGRECVNGAPADDSCTDYSDTDGDIGDLSRAVTGTFRVCWRSPMTGTEGTAPHWASPPSDREGDFKASHGADFNGSLPKTTDSVQCGDAETRGAAVRMAAPGR